MRPAADHWDEQKEKRLEWIEALQTAVLGDEGFADGTSVAYEAEEGATG